MFRKKYIHIISKIGSRANENDETNAEITFKESEWAKEYCDSFMFNLRSARFNNPRIGKN